MTKLTIVRNEWFRGLGGLVSTLCRRDDGRKCCLGFYALQAGYTLDEIGGNRTPGQLHRSTKKDLFNSGLVNEETFSTPVADALMMINDDMTITDKVREQRLTEKFASIGVEVEFV